MPPELRDPADPREWLRRARSSLALAKAGPPAPEVLYEDAVRTRYPGVEEVTVDEYREAVELAGRVMRWAEEEIEGSGMSPDRETHAEV